MNLAIVATPTFVSLLNPKNLHYRSDRCGVETAPVDCALFISLLLLYATAP